MNEWQLIEETGKVTTTLADRREVTVAWDGGDRSLYVSVLVPAPQGQGQQAQPRVYTAPLSLLAALALVPRDFHEYFAAIHEQARAEAEGEAMELVQGYLERAPLPFPEPAKALELLNKSMKAATQAERLSLDLAAADAFEDVQPV